MNDPELKQPDDRNPELSDSQSVNTETRAPQAKHNPADETTSGSSFKRVLVTVLIFACAAGLAAAGWRFGLRDNLPRFSDPPLVKVTGLTYSRSLYQSE